LRIVDLSRVIEGRVPYPLFQTHPKVSFTRVESSAFIDRRGKTVDQLPVESFVKSAVLLDVSGKTVGEVDDEDLEAAEEAAGISIRDGEAVILNTCWDKVSIKRRTRFPGLSGNAVDYLLFKRIAEIGVDCPSVDKGDSMRSHRALLRKGVPVIEGLCNLVEIDQSRFRFLMLPLRLRAAISPVRVLALLDEAYW
jgi:arylformamidase